MDSSSVTRVGELVLLEYPFTNYSGSKVRPAVIIAQSSVQHNDLTVAFVTSELDSYCYDASAIVFDADDLISGVIHKKSVIRVDKVLVIEEAKVKRSNVARLTKAKVDELLRAWARIMVHSHYEGVHAPGVKKPYTVGDRIPYAGRVFDEKEIAALVDSSLDFWLTTGRYAEKFESDFAKFLGVKHCSLTNSGSSANLLAFMALTSPKLGERRIKKGDEVITVAAAFPTTVAPIIQYGAVPVFVDVTLPTYNIDCAQLDKALSAKTKAVMIAHTLGNPFDIAAVRSFCDRHGLWLIEDNCDALGSKYRGLDDQKNRRLEDLTANPPTIQQSDPQYQYTGTFGHIGTSSFYPPHHMTMGEGGAVYTNDGLLKRLIESFRDWGRDCWCPSGRDNTCKQRFTQQFGELPKGYDHKYVYSHFGYNLKVTDMQAAIGCAQLEKLPDFIEARKTNWKMLRNGLADLSEKFILPEPTPNSDPSWFGFLLTVKEKAGFTRDEIVGHLEKKGIQTRMLFAGNLIKHPCFDEMRKEGKGYRIVSTAQPLNASTSLLPNTDRIMRDTFWIGVYPGMTQEMILFTIHSIKEILTERNT